MVSLTPPRAGCESSYWFLPVHYHPEATRCDKATFCAALSAEGLSVMTDYRPGMPHGQDWFVKRRVFGNSGYPWASPDYKGDPNRRFACPNAHAMIESHFNLMLHENWDGQEIDDAVAIFHKITAAFAAG